MHKTLFVMLACAGFFGTTTTGITAEEHSHPDSAAGFAAQDGSERESMLRDENNDAKKNDTQSRRGIVAVTKKDNSATVGPPRDHVRFGSMIMVREGEVARNVVSIFGSVRVDGEVKGDVVVLMGRADINGVVRGDLVTPLSRVSMGPRAEVRGDFVAPFSGVTQPEDVRIGGNQVVISPFPAVARWEWVRDWIAECLARARLASPALGWTLAVLGGSLLFYTVFAMLFGGAIEHGRRVMEKTPGRVVLIGLAAPMVMPVLLFLLIASGVGLLALPFLLLALLAIGLYGKAALLSAFGRVVTGFSPEPAWQNAALTTFIGGVLVAALYLVPGAGLVLWALTGWLGLSLGILAFTEQVRRESAQAVVSAGGAGSPEAGFRPEIQADATFPRETEPGTAPPPAAAVRIGFWPRLGAGLIDLVLIAFLSAILGGGLFPLWLMVYYFVFWAARGSSVGGLAFDLQVVWLDGRPLDWPGSMVRTLGAALSVLPFGLGLFWVAWDKEYQTWHDKIAGTVVVRIPKKTSVVQPGQ